MKLNSEPSRAGAVRLNVPLRDEVVLTYSPSGSLRKGQG
jgi:hypothetical protein